MSGSKSSRRADQIKALAETLTLLVKEEIDTVIGHMKGNISKMCQQNGINFKNDGKDLVLRGTVLEYKGSPIGDVFES